MLDVAPSHRCVDHPVSVAPHGVWMRAIAATDYGLYVGHEFVPKGDALAAMRAAYELCDV